MIKSISQLCLSLVVLLIGMLWHMTGQAFQLVDLEKQLQKSQIVEGDFEQKRFLKSMHKPIPSRGRFVLVLNQGMLWHLQQPFEDLLRVRPTGVEQRNEQGEWIHTGEKSIQKNQVALFLDLLAGKTEKLQQQFDIQLLGNPKDWTLSLTPNNLLMQQIFSSIEVSGQQAVQRIVLNEKQGDRVEIRFSHLRINAGLNDADKAMLLP